MFISHAHQVTQLVHQQTQSALSCMGDAAVQAVVSHMQNGYQQPIYQTGRLQQDVQWGFEEDGHHIDIGSTLPYATFVHQGTTSMSPRPYLAQGLTNAAPALFQTLVKTLELLERR